MKDILMVVHTMGNLQPTDNDRYTYLAKMLMKENAKVEIVTSDFEHHKKSYRDLSVARKHPFKISFLHENSYKKNVSIARILGHISFSIRLSDFLKNREKPDVIYCAVPPTVSAFVAARYAKKQNIKFVIDVQDLWPESFYIVLGKNKLTQAILTPIEYLVNQVYKQADSVVAVSDTYVKRVLCNNTKCQYPLSIYLGTDIDLVENATKDSPFDMDKKNDEFWVGYIGNIGRSYDFETLFHALKILKLRGINNIRLMIVGDGNERERVEDLIQKVYPQATITGYLPYERMLSYLKKFDVAVNPIVKGGASSVVNKVGDYAAAGIPVVNTQDNQEYRNLVETYRCGLNVNPEDSSDLAEKILYLYENEEERTEMGKSNYRLFMDKFNRKKTYPKVVSELLKEK